MIKVTKIETIKIPCIGTCEVCHKEDVGLKRTYFYYENIKCECHSPCHFDLIEHCYDCVPEIPSNTRVKFKVDNSIKEIRRLKIKNIINEEN